jgi:NTP pyrophosphatase (non-canonical NTP hydrolase)
MKSVHKQVLSRFKKNKALTLLVILHLIALTITNNIFSIAIITGKASWLLALIYGLNVSMFGIVVILCWERIKHLIVCDQEVSHADMVKTLSKSGDAIACDLKLMDETTHEHTSAQLLLETCLHLIAKGNHLDLIKKQVVYNKKIDPDVFEQIDHELASRLKASQSNTNASITTLDAQKAHVLHMALGIAGEASEFLDAVVKWVFEGEPRDDKNLKEELGDLDFYEEGARQGLGLTLDQVLQANINKLSQRYQGFKYSDQAAQLRADKAQEEG